MPLIEWRKEYETGNPGVDHEHQELIALLNALYDAMTADRPADQILDGLGEVFARISAHFALEEQEMREADYPERGDHKDNHEILLDDIRDIMDAYETGAFDAKRDAFGERLHDWFVNHFKTFDRKLHGQL